MLLNEVRGWAKATLPTYQDRKVFFEAIVNGEPDPVELLRAGDEHGGARPDRSGTAVLTSLPDELTHLDEAGRARMVDVGDKPVTDRRARGARRRCACRPRPPRPWPAATRPRAT